MSALRKSEYLLKLEKESSEVSMRYKEKIRVISCIDPFELASEEMDTNISSFPAVTSWDIFNYLLLTHSFYTAEQMKVHKSLSGYKYFEAGFVHNLGAKKIGENVAVVGKVKHSQRMNELPLNVWVICALDGAIISAHCTCMAGLSEVCSHVAAILYGLECIHNSAANTACTDVKAEWVIPSIQNVPLVKLNEMKLKRSAKTDSSLPNKNIPPAIPAIEGQELVELLQEIKDSEDDAVLMRVVLPFASDLETKISKLPLTYDVYKEELENISYSDLMKISLDFDEKLDNEQIDKIINATINQSNSREWFSQRTGRITASQFKRVCKTSISKPSLSLIKGICYPLKINFKTKATVWGLKNETLALDIYRMELAKRHKSLTVEKTVLHVDAVHCFLAASPDSLVSCECHGKGCVEVKCPFLLKSLSLEQYCAQKNSFLVNSDGKFLLKRDHAYFYQVQLQMRVTQTSYCDFVVWSPDIYFHQRILYDEDFWSNNFQKAFDFHKKVVLPELFGRYFTKGRHLDQRWCTCNRVDDGQVMIRCSNDLCETVWFHLSCLGLSDIPDESWTCENCT